jgi:hypothetical protein
MKEEKHVGMRRVHSAENKKIFERKGNSRLHRKTQKVVLGESLTNGQRRTGDPCHAVQCVSSHGDHGAILPVFLRSSNILWLSVR